MSSNTTSHMQTRIYHRVESVRNLTESTYILRLDKNGLDFTPGQYISVGPKGDINMREYSVYSSSKDDFLEILVKEVDGGYVSRKLKQLKPGQDVVVDGPFGFFTLEDDQRRKKLCFIATGTGISPFHSFVRSYNDLDYELIHGTRYVMEDYELDQFHPDRVIRCISREESKYFTGRVTDYLRNRVAEGKIDTEALYYLCGNCDMIYESFDILSEAGVENTQLFAEVYF